MRVRWINGIAVVGIGPHAAGDPVPPSVDLADTCRGSRGVILDLAGCKVPSSELFGQMIHAHRAAAAIGTPMRVCCPPGLVWESLTETRLDRVVAVFETLAETLEDFDPLIE
jgi:anti-anti-sigma regulatory factor